MACRALLSGNRNRRFSLVVPKTRRVGRRYGVIGKVAYLEKGHRHIYTHDTVEPATLHMEVGETDSQSDF